MNTMTIKNIIFDFGGVLVDWDPRYFYRSYFSDSEEMEYFLTNICNDAWNMKVDSGMPFIQAVELLQAEYPEYSEAIQLFADRWEDMLKSEIPESVELLREVKSRGFRLFGLTNWSAETIPIAYRRFDFFKLFEGIVVSGEEKVAKPDKRIFEIILERYGLDAEETIFIDDNRDNIKSAQEMGFKAILFDNISNVRQQLEALTTHAL